MPKTPDETKKGLECCTSRDCGGSKCPYFNEKSCNAAKSADALAFIQQLEAQNAEKDERIQHLEKRVIHLEALNQSNLSVITMQERTRDRLQEQISRLEADKQQLEGMLSHMNQLRDAAAGRALKMEERAHQLEAERDALMHWAKGRCDTCAHKDDCVKHDPDPEGYVMHWYDDCEIWEWRGVQKEE